MSACRLCGNQPLTPILSLGKTPIADGLLSEADLTELELTVALDFAFCDVCSLAQIEESVDPEILFCRDYPYYSSVSPHLLAHFTASAEQIVARRGLGPDSLVVEAASNDGYMLQTFVKHGIRVLGIDPASGPAKAALERGIETLNTFFTYELADRLVGQQGLRADVFLGNNVLAHVPDLNGFVAGIRRLLKPDGAAVIECPYAVDLVDHCEFDTIYHQHLCYFTVTSLDNVFRRHELFLNDVERTSIHGGSLRITVESQPRPRPQVEALLAQEAARGVNTAAFYQSLALRAGRIRDELSRLLSELRGKGMRIAAYGAAAKGTTLCSYVGIDRNLVEYVVDRNPHKAGRYMSGSRIPIVPPTRLSEDKPDYLLVLAWNFFDEIKQQERAFAQAGGRFIVPIPEVRIV